jgi:hypothetical protein
VRRNDQDQSELDDSLKFELNCKEIDLNKNNS